MKTLRLFNSRTVLVIVFLVTLISVLLSRADVTLSAPAKPRTAPAVVVPIKSAPVNRGKNLAQAAVNRSEIRGVWLTNIDSDVLFDRDHLSDSVKEMARLNINTLYPAVWNWGYTLYPSNTSKHVIGVAIDPRPEAEGLKGRDIVAELVQQGHKQGMAVIPWFEFGFMAPEDSELARLHPDWLTQRRDGSQVWMEGIYPRVWLNPFRPEVQKFIQNLILEIATQHDVDGIQLDDHFGLPNEFGYDDYTVRLYQREHQGKSPPANPNDREWVRWRANKITAFTRQVFQAVKARKNNVLFTLSPNNYAFSYNHSLQDWLTWEREGLVEELVLQVYRDNVNSFIAELNTPEVQDARRHIPTAVGVLTGLKDRSVPIRTVSRQVEIVRNQGFAGVSFFFYETMWRMSNEPERDRKAAFQTLLSPAAPRPNILQGWLPPR